VRLLLTFLACADDRGPDALTVYARASLDLRGVRPSMAEAQALLADPAGLDAALDALPDDSRFGWQLALHYAPTWQTRADESDVATREAAVPDRGALLASTGEEPLRLVAWIADHDRPWTDIVRAEGSVADEVLAQNWPVDYPSGATGWQWVRATDGRPMAGVLSSTGLWWRYTSTYGNANRGRANALSRILLCNDYLERPIVFDPSLDLTDEAAVQDAVHNDVACVSCHGGVDPVGAYLWGFYSEFIDATSEWARYHPERETHWEDFGTPPGYAGQPGRGGGIDELGVFLASDPRLVSCVVQRTREALLQRSLTRADDPALLRHREAMLAGGVTLRALVRDVLKDPDYRAVEGDGAPWKQLRADTWASAVEDLTGWNFEVSGKSAFREDIAGLRSLAGDSRAVAVATPTPTPTMVEVHARWAHAAARHAAERDAAAETPRLFTRARFDAADDEPTARAQIVDLHLRVLSEVVAADAPSVDEELDLWREGYLAGGPVEAWARVLELLLRDPAFVVY
jgi:hypothetical protein